MRLKPPGIPTLDLTTDGSFGSIDDAIFETSEVQPAAPPNFFTFEEVQSNGFEQGYNTDGTTQFNTKPEAHSIRVWRSPTRPPRPPIRERPVPRPRRCRSRRTRASR